MTKYYNGWNRIANDDNALLEGIKGNGVISGLAVSEKGTGANMSVDIATGSYIANGTLVTKAAVTNVAITAAHATLPRKTIILGDSSGNLTALDGTEAAIAPSGQTGVLTTSPVAPDITANKIILAEIYVPAAATSIINDYITDRRVILPQANLLDDTAGGTDALTTKAPTSNVLYDLGLSKISHSLATAADDMLMASGAGVFIKKTLAETKSKLGIASDIATHAALQTGIHGFTDFILEDTTARTYAANTWYTIGGAFYAQQVFLLVGVYVVNPDSGQGGAGHWMSVGFGMTGLVGWQNHTPTIPFVFPLHGHNWSDLNCSLMPTTDTNGTHHLQIMFSGNVPVSAGGWVRLYCKSLFGFY